MSKASTTVVAPVTPIKAEGASVHADIPKREPHWSPRRIAVIKAMRALNATNSAQAVTASEIAKKAGTVEGIKLSDRVDFVKIILDIYRTSELLHNGYAKSIRNAGERELRYYLTKKGQTTAMVNPVKEVKEKPAKKEKAAEKAESK